MRVLMPWFSDDNIKKNLELVDMLKAIGDKYNVSSPRVILAWMLAEHKERKHTFLCHLEPALHPNVRLYAVIPLPGCRTAARVEDNSSAVELQLSPEDIIEIRTLCENADIKGDRLPEIARAPMDCIPLKEWKDE